MQLFLCYQRRPFAVPSLLLKTEKLQLPSLFLEYTLRFYKIRSKQSGIRESIIQFVTRASLLFFWWAILEAFSAFQMSYRNKLDNTSLSPFPHSCFHNHFLEVLHSSFYLRLWFGRNPYKNNYPLSGYSKLLWNDCWTGLISDLMATRILLAGDDVQRGHCLILWNVCSLRYNKN